MKSAINKALAALTLSVLAVAAYAQDTFQPQGLEKITINSFTCSGFYRTPAFKCEPTKLPAYVARANTGGHEALVFISHGGGGLDRRHSDYARALAAKGMNAVVVGHYEGRGLDQVYKDYNGARDKGGSSQSQAIDILAASSQLKQMPEWRDSRLGYIGESLGGGSAITITRPYIESIVADLTNRPVHNIDAVVSLYPGCFERSTIERFRTVPFLMIIGTLDDETPVAECQKQVDWMNGKGAVAKLVTIPDQHHDFDAPYTNRWHPQSQNLSKCANLRDGKTITLESNGKQWPQTPEGAKAMQDSCAKFGHYGGNTGDPKTGYEVWTEFFRKNLL